MESLAQTWPRSLPESTGQQRFPFKRAKVRPSSGLCAAFSCKGGPRATALAGRQLTALSALLGTRTSCSAGESSLFLPAWKVREILAMSVSLQIGSRETPSYVPQ